MCAAGDGLTSEQRQLQDEALKFARNEFTPQLMAHWDEKVLTQLISFAHMICAVRVTGSVSS